MKRPLSVWLVQILLSLVSLIMLSILVARTVVMFRYLWGSSPPPMEVLLAFAILLTNIGIIGFFLLTVFAIEKRWSRSRIMGLAALLILFALFIYRRLSPLPPGQGLSRMTYDTPGERGMAFILDVLLFIGYWLLFLRFGFSKKAREFFSQPDAQQG